MLSCSLSKRGLHQRSTNCMEVYRLLQLSVQACQENPCRNPVGDEYLIAIVADPVPCAAFSVPSILALFWPHQPKFLSSNQQGYFEMTPRKSQHVRKPTTTREGKRAPSPASDPKITKKKPLEFGQKVRCPNRLCLFRR